MSTRYSLLGSAVLISAFAFPALAGWGPDGATIRNTTSHIPKVAATSDGAHGSFVVWQEENSPGVGILRAQHVLPTGDIDPFWPAEGFVLCDVATARGALGAIGDGLGGAYVWWKEGATIFLTRITPDGVVAGGWPVRGRSIGTTIPSVVHPAVISDGANGIYLAWVTSTILQPDPTSVLAIHLGPSNAGAGGWPNGSRGIAGGDPVATLDLWPSLALAPDGGVFLAWARYSEDPGEVPSGYLLRRLTASGLSAANWGQEGVAIAEFHGEWLYDNSPVSSLCAISEDGEGGVFAVLGLLSDWGSSGGVESRLLRLQGDGTPAAGWPEAGLGVNSTWYADFGPDASHSLSYDGAGGALVGTATYGLHGSDSYSVAAAGADGTWKPSSTAGGYYFGREFVPNGRGGVFYASFYPKGPYQMYEPYAHLQVVQSLAPPGWSDFLEIHFETNLVWFGDIALAESGDGGAFLFWSQEREKFGLFARRFNGAGQVTGVEPGVGVSALALGRLRYVAGDGVWVSLAIPSGREATLEVFDLGGRRVASARVAAGNREVVVPGTSQLSSGLYFARLSADRAVASGKVVVAR